MKKLILLFVPLTAILFLLLFTGCSHNRTRNSETAGMYVATVKIQTEPTKARIFVEGEYLGKSPLKYKVWYNEEKKINIVAEPIYPNQFPQNVYLNVPPVPQKITLYMDKKPLSPYETDEEESNEQKQEIIQPVIKTVVQEKLIEKEIPVILPVIYFELDKTELLPDELLKLDKLAEIMIKNIVYNLNIYGYADEQGDLEYNLNLSLRRANSVAEYRMEKDVSAERLIVSGRGEQRIINQEGDTTGYANSRRVDFQMFIPEKKKTEE